MNALEGKLSRTLEDYLRTIRDLADGDGSVRSVDIAAALGVSRPSVHTALERLARRGLVRHDRYCSVLLTEPGRAVAQEILEKRRLARRLMEEILRRNPEAARDEVCAIEHLSRETLSSLVETLEAAGARLEAAEA